MNNLKYYFYALRPQQWIKNAFVFLPLIFGKMLFVYPVNLKTTIAFILFSLAASSVYLINDALDVKRDVIHPVKRLRPIASGKINREAAIFLGILLGVLSLISSCCLNLFFAVVILIYFIFNFLYVKILKELVIIDIFCLATFYLLRILSGGIVSGVALSHWIVVATALLALFLGFSKRRQELQVLRHAAHLHRHSLRKYNTFFIDQMISVTTASIVVTYLLYTVDARTVADFGTHNLLWTAPFVCYGIFRYLYLIHKIKRDGDPTRMLMSDRTMQLNIILWLISCVIVIYFKL